MSVLFAITTLQKLDIFKIDGVISVTKMSLKKNTKLAQSVSDEKNEKDDEDDEDEGDEGDDEDDEDDGYDEDDEDDELMMN